MSFKNEIVVNNIVKNVHTNEVSVELKTNYLGEEVTKSIPRGEMNYKGLRDLCSFGSPFLSLEEINKFFDSFAEDEENLPLKKVFNLLGWHKVEGKLCFLHRQAMYKGSEQGLSYVGSLDLSQKGSLSEQLDFFNTKVKKFVGLQTVCAVALSSAIVGMLPEKDLKFIFHIEGESTSGKTTSLMLAGSMWGNPQISPKGIVRNWNTTANGLIQAVGGNKGILIGLDELSMTDANTTQLTYLLTGGTDKRRWSSNDGVEKDFRTVFMSTGEIQFKKSNFGGIAVRLFEIKNYNFTESKENADMILSSIHANYGNIGYEFAKVLSSYTPEKIQEILEKDTAKVIKRIKFHAEKQGKQYSPLFSRLAEKIATVVVASRLAKHKLGMEFDIKEIVDFLICESTILQAGQEQSNEAMIKFFEEYLKNKSKFPEKVDFNVAGIWGKTVVQKGNITEIVILYNRFTEIMGKLGYPDTRSLFRSLKEKGYIKCEEGKNYLRRNIGSLTKTPVVVIDVPMVKEASDIVL